MEHIQDGDSNCSGGGSSGNDEIVPTRASLFDSLPVDCIEVIISRTSPRDACVLASVSKTFNLVAQSDLVWEKFLPPEYASLVRPSLTYSSKKDIYLSLLNSVLIDGGKKSFWLDKSSGKKCYMLSAMDLTIFWGNDPNYWRWISVPDSKFVKVAHLWRVCRLEIRVKISCGMLSKGTHYSVYVVFKREHAHVAAEVGFVGKGSTKTLVFLQSLDADSLNRMRKIVLEVARRRSVATRNVEVPKERRDGWREVELGKFYINNGGCEDGSDEIEISIKDIKVDHWKSGLLIQGIEIRPERRN